MAVPGELDGAHPLLSLPILGHGVDGLPSRGPRPMSASPEARYSAESLGIGILRETSVGFPVPRCGTFS
jgi:hypothetical protein